MVRGILALVIGTISLIGLMGVDGVQPVNAAPLMQSGRPNPGTLAIVGASGAQLYATPGGESLQALTPGTVLTAVGRSADNLWAVVYNDANLSGWVEVSEVVLFGIEQLPVMVEGTIPVAAPTSASRGHHRKRLHCCRRRRQHLWQQLHRCLLQHQHLAQFRRQRHPPHHPQHRSLPYHQQSLLQLVGQRVARTA